MDQCLCGLHGKEFSDLTIELKKKSKTNKPQNKQRKEQTQKITNKTIFSKDRRAAARMNHGKI